MSMHQVGRYLQACRKAAHLTQEAVAAALGVTARTISKWETGRETPGAALLAHYVDTVRADPVLVHALLLDKALPPDITDETISRAGVRLHTGVGAPDSREAAERAWIERLQAIEAQIDQGEREQVRQAIETLLRGWLPRGRRTRLV